MGAQYLGELVGSGFRVPSGALVKVGGASGRDRPV